MSIKEILDEIASTGSTNDKVKILTKYKDNSILKRILYLAYSKRVKFYIKQIPQYNFDSNFEHITLEHASKLLDKLSTREFTGNQGIEWLQNILNSLKSDDAIVIERIIDKDLRIGMNRSLINRVFKDLIEKTPYMGAIPYNLEKAKKIFEKGPGISQIKMDGTYRNAIIRAGEVELETRSGEVSHIQDANFLNELSQFDDCVLNGELTIPGVHRYIANGMVASIIDIEEKREERGEEETKKKINQFEKRNPDWTYENAINSIVYTVWDQLTIDEYFDKKSTRSYNNRLMILINELNVINCKYIKLVESKPVNTIEEALAHFEEALNRGEEGTVLKAVSGEWKDGKPNWQIKIKLEMTIDLKIVGFNYGTGKNSDLISSLNCESSDGLVKTRPTGISEDDMKYITENQDKLIGTIIECKCSGLSRDNEGNYSLLHPVFKCFRSDKDTCDSLESIKKIENACKGLN